MEPTIYSQENETLEVSAAAKIYEQLFIESTFGPQLEGLTAEEATRALEDPRTISTEMELNGETYQVPVLAPLEFASWYNPAFTEKIETGAAKYFYAALPGTPFSEELIQQMREKLAGQEIVIFYDEIEDSGRDTEVDELLSSAQATFDYLPLGQDGKGATITQFGGVALLTDRDGLPPTEEQSFSDLVNMGLKEVHTDREKATRTLTKPVSDIDLDQIWDFYEESFSKVNENHPLMQSFDKEGLRSMLDSQDSLAAVHSEDGRVVTLAFISQLSECEWLREKYFEQKYPAYFSNKNIAHMPTIVTDEKYRGQDMTSKLISILIEAAVEAKTDVVILGECNDETVDLIPLLVNSFFDGKTVDMKMDWEALAKYRYKAVKATF